MARMTPYVYLIDDLTSEKAEKLRKAMIVNERIGEISVKLNSGVVTVTASKDPEAEVKMACSIAGCVFRMKVSKKKASYYA